MILSVSRRCDIPRFSFDWFLERLEAGFVEVKNPFNPRQIRQVCLLPPSPERPPGESVEVLAFWTRDPANILNYSESLEGRGYRFFVMTSLTSYPALLEPNVPPTEAVIETMVKLARKTSPERVIWRYDPVFLSDKTGYESHRRNFADLAGRLEGSVKRVIVSVYDEYPGAERRLSALEQKGCLTRFPHYAVDPQGKRSLLSEFRGLLSELASIAHGKGMEMQSCAEEDLSDAGIKSGACIDGEYMASQFGISIPGRDRGQGRKGCLCVQSVDIGTYGRCPAGCVYCYGLR